jgi:hypothetical protein
MSIDELLVENSPARFATSTVGESRIDIPAAITVIDGADVGINRALARGNINGMAIVPSCRSPGSQCQVTITAGRS